MANDVFFSTTSFGKVALIVNMYKFVQKHRAKDGTVTWKCSQSDCKAMCHTKGETLDVTDRAQIDHSHSADFKKMSREILCAAVKKSGTRNLSAKPGKLISQELASSPTLAANITTQDLDLIRRTLRNTRRRGKVHLTLPKSPVDVHKSLLDLDVKTSEGEDFCLLNDSDSGVIVFSCHKNIAFAAECKTLLGDGTFKYVPKQFLQLFTIYGEIKNHFVPLVFCLLSNKSAMAYEKALRFVKQQCSTWQVTEFVTDFEVAIHNAVTDVWPQVTLLECRFHLRQCWNRQIQQCHLQKEYEERGPIGTWLGNLFGLSLLSSDLVSFVFGDGFAPDAPPEVLALSQYLSENYLAPCSKSLPASRHTHSCATNSCKSFHSHLKSYFQCPHPDIFNFVAGLKSQQALVYVKLNSVGAKT